MRIVPQSRTVIHMGPGVEGAKSRTRASGRSPAPGRRKDEPVKILCIGAGSMGRRRLRDLVHLNPGRIMLLESQPERCRNTAATVEEEWASVRAFHAILRSAAEKREIRIEGAADHAGES